MVEEVGEGVTEGATETAVVEMEEDQMVVVEPLEEAEEGQSEEEVEDSAVEEVEVPAQ